MFRTRFMLALVASGVSVAACGPESPAAPVEAALEAVPLVHPPTLTQADFMEGGDPGPPVIGPSDDGPVPVQFDGEPFSRPLAQIIGPRTSGDFQEGFAGAFGFHRYIGNVGKVTTIAHVSVQGKHLGSKTGTNQDYTPFLIDFGRVKKIYVFPKIYTDHECGLVVTGESQHWASWQFYQATSVQNWGVDQAFSQARPYSQGACANEDVGGHGEDRASGGGIVCTYWITYDLDTGEILRAELLFCSSTGGVTM